jgi:hypothetical protein
MFFAQKEEVGKRLLFTNLVDPKTAPKRPTGAQSLHLEGLSFSFSDYGFDVV